MSRPPSALPAPATKAFDILVHADVAFKDGRRIEIGGHFTRALGKLFAR